MINVAQIGVGYWGPNLLRNAIENDECSVRIVIDKSEERRAFVRKHYPGMLVSENPEDVFENPDIDAVIIATPASTHCQLAVNALGSAKHILVEKPLAMSVAEVDQITHLSREHSLVAMVGHTFIFNAAVRYLRNLMESGELGDIRYIYSQRLNLGRIRNDVNALWNLAPHDVSIIQYLLGDPEPVSVHYHGMDYVQPGIDDVGFLHLEYSDKIIVNIHVSWLDPNRIRSMTVVGSKKMVVYDDVAENKIAIYDKAIEPRAVIGQQMDYDKPEYLVFDHRSGDVVYPRIQYVEPLQCQFNHFIQCIKGHEECLTGPDHARGVVGILERA